MSHAEMCYLTIFIYTFDQKTVNGWLRVDLQIYMLVVMIYDIKKNLQPIYNKSTAWLNIPLEFNLAFWSHEYSLMNVIY